MANLLSTQTQGTIARVADIHNFLDQANDLFKPSTPKARKQIEDRRNELRRLKEDCLGREQILYDKLGVDGIEDLQQRIEEITKKLEPFQNSCLNRMPLIQEMAADKKTLAQLEAELQPRVNEWLFDARDEGLTYAAAKNKVGEVLAAFIEDNRKVLGSNQKVNVKQLTEKLDLKRVAGKYQLQIKKGSLENYKRELRFGLRNPEDTPTGARFELYTEYDPIGFTTKQLVYYPYYKLTADQMAFAKSKDGDEMWRMFKEQIISLADSTLQDSARKVMNSSILAREDFFINSDAEVKGILGEVETLIIFTELTKKVPDGTFLDFLGNATKNGDKIGIDILLEGEGIQVKNYKTYGTEKINEGINLSETITLDGFLDKLKGSLGRDQLETISDFYITRAYHVWATKAYSPTLKRLQLFDTRIKQFFQGYISDFLPLEKYEQITRLGKEVELNNASNLFYFIGGRRLLPVSAILNHYENYLDRVLNGLEENERRGLAVNLSHYSGDTYKTYYKAKGDKKQSYLDNFNYQNVYNAISMQYTINLNVDLLTSELLK